MANWYLERKGCVSLERKEEERAECRCNIGKWAEQEIVGLSL